MKLAATTEPLPVAQGVFDMKMAATTEPLPGTPSNILHATPTR